MMTAADRISNTQIEPGPSRWVGLVSDAWHESAKDATANGFRSQLGLPVDRPIVMTGHQAEFWHPGILAKYMAAEAAAEALNAGSAWVVVDQDTNTAATLRYPVRTDTNGLGVKAWEPLESLDQLTEGGIPTGKIPPGQPAAEPLEGVRFAAESIGDGLRRVRVSLAKHAGARSLAEQIAQSTQDLLGGLVAPAPTVFATAIARTDLFAELVDRMRSDAMACARAYNTSTRIHGAANVAELDTTGDTELPMWKLAPNQPRERVRASMLASTPIEQLAPRALMMTGLLRLAGCDLFIHGLGGGVYDPITEAWISAWLGRTLAPAAVVTATVRLPIDFDAISPEEIDRAVWRAHHAKHTPIELGDAAAQTRKMELVETIRELKAAGRDPRSAFNELHELLSRVQAQQAGQVAQLDASAASAVKRWKDASIAYDRTWPFPIYPLADLLELRSRIRASFDGNV